MTLQEKKRKLRERKKTSAFHGKHEKSFSQAKKGVKPKKKEKITRTAHTQTTHRMSEDFSAVTEVLYHSKCYKYDIPPHSHKAGEWCYGSSCTPASIQMFEKRLSSRSIAPLPASGNRRSRSITPEITGDSGEDVLAPIPHHHQQQQQQLKVAEIKTGIVHYFTIQPNTIYRAEDSTRYFVFVSPEEGTRIGIGFKKRDESSHFLECIRPLVPRVSIYTHDIEESLLLQNTRHRQYKHNTNASSSSSSITVTATSNNGSDSNEDLEAPIQVPDIRSAGSGEYPALASGRFPDHFAAASTTPSLRGEEPTLSVSENGVRVPRASLTGDLAQSAPVNDEVKSAATTTTNNNNNSNADEIAAVSVPDDKKTEGSGSGSSVVGRKHGDEDISQEVWRKHKKHVFVLSIAGKPIYTRYGDDQKLAPFMASMMALVSFVEDSKDNIRYFIAGSVKVVFFVRGPIYLACISRNKDETVAELSRHLFFVHSQIVSTLTFSTITKILSKRPDFDLRGLLTDTDLVIDNLVHSFNHHLGLALGAIQPLSLRPDTRTKIETAFLEAACPELLFAVLFTDFSLIHLACPRKIALNPIDIYMVMNFVNSSTSFKISTTSWTPICLPVFDSKGFLHAYVYYIAANICLVMLSTKVDAFYNINEAAKAFTESLERQSAMNTIIDACSRPQYRIKELSSPGLRHFALKSTLLKQVTAPALIPPDNTPARQKRLFRIYQMLRNAAERPANGLATQTQAGPHRIYYTVSRTETAIVWVTNDFELYAVFSPLESKASAVKSCNKIISYVLGHESVLFITNIPILPFKG